MSTDQNSPPGQKNQRMFERLGTTLVCLMMVCVGISMTQIGRRIVPGWDAGILPVLALLVSLERMISHKRVKRLVVFSKEWVLYQLTHWVVILVVLKIILLIASPPESWRMEFQLWRIDFFDQFVDTTYTYAVLFILIIWMVTGYFAGLLDEMSLEESLLRQETAIIAPAEGTPARERLLGMVFSIGFVLVAITAVLRLDFRIMMGGVDPGGQIIKPLPYLAAGSWNVLLYFLLGLGLMSLSQFARMNARWSFQNIEVIPRIAARWAGYSIGFLLLLAFLVSLLPTSYSIGLLSSIAQVLLVIYGFILYVVGFLLSIVIFLVGLLAQWLGLGNIEQGSVPIQPIIPPEISETMVVDGTNPWWDLIKSLVFWTIFIGLVGFSLISFARQHGDLWNSLSGFRVISWLTNAWQGLRNLFKGVNQQLSTFVDSGLARFRSGPQAGRGRGIRAWSSYRNLDNRQRVLHTFFMMLRQSDRKGIHRKGSATPFEFAQKLEHEIPENEEAIEGITDAFMIARYSKIDVSTEEASLARRYWMKIKKTLNTIHK